MKDIFGYSTTGGIGFTGTRDGMTQAQKDTFVVEFRTHGKDAPFYEHGDCLGSDADSHKLVRRHFPQMKIHIRPSVNQHMRAFCRGDIIYAPKLSLERDQEIVDDSRVLFATPSHFKEIQRSGTWATIRRARKSNVPRLIIWPDGSVMREGFETLVDKAL